MTILGGTQDGMIQAAERIVANPHPDHMREYRQVTGKEPSIESMLVNSVRGAEIAAYSINGADALIGGISSAGLICREIWFLTTASAKERRRWLLREARRMLALADEYFDGLTVFGQTIPVDYPEGINFAAHLGFRRAGTTYGPDGDELAIMERCRLWARKT